MTYAFPIKRGILCRKISRTNGAKATRLASQFAIRAHPSRVSPLSGTFTDCRADVIVILNNIILIQGLQTSARNLHLPWV